MVNDPWFCNAALWMDALQRMVDEDPMLTYLDPKFYKEHVLD